MHVVMAAGVIDEMQMLDRVFAPAFTAAALAHLFDGFTQLKEGAVSLFRAPVFQDRGRGNRRALQIRRHGLLKGGQLFEQRQLQAVEAQSVALGSEPLGNSSNVMQLEGRRHRADLSDGAQKAGRVRGPFRI